MIFTSVVSVLVSTYVEPEWFNRHPMVWCLLRLEYISFFGPFLIMLLNEFERSHPGEITYVIIGLLIEMHTSLGPNMLEQLIFQDMAVNNKIGTLSQIWDNMGSYLAYFLCLPTFLIAQYLNTGDLVRQQSSWVPFHWNVVEL